MAKNQEIIKIESQPVLDGEIVARTLMFFWLVDCSGSMAGKKIEIVNQTISEVIPDIKNAVIANAPNTKIIMKAIKFSSTASWHIGPQGLPIDSFIWQPLTAGGETSTAQAINMLCDELEVEKMTKRGLPPVCILLSDGYCTDSEESYNSAINKLNSLPWGIKAIRLVIAIGDERGYGEESLKEFVNQELGVLKADTPEKLTEYIKWASLSASISSTHSKGFQTDSDSNVNLGEPPLITSKGGVF